MSERNKVVLFMDDDKKPFGEFETPFRFELDTRRLVDGEHVLTIIGKSPAGREGIRKVPFMVQNGPSIQIDGVAPNETVVGVIPVMINAYGSADSKNFLVEGSETPRSVPSWFWAAIVFFLGWAANYFITSMQ